MLVNFVFTKKGQPDSKQMNNVGTRTEIIAILNKMIDDHSGKSSCIFHLNGDITIDIAFGFGVMKGKGTMVRDVVQSLGELQRETQFSFIQNGHVSPVIWEIVAHNTRAKRVLCNSVEYPSVQHMEGSFPADATVVTRPLAVDFLKEQFGKNGIIPMVSNPSQN